MNSNTAILEVENLKKYYDVSSGIHRKTKPKLVKAVDGVDFTIKRGKTLAIVGESGCGKTTIARMLLKLEHPTDGSIQFNGSNINDYEKVDLKQYRTKVQAVFQDPWASLNPRIRVKKLITEPLVVNTNLSKHEIERKLESVISDVGLRSAQKNNYPHEFSGGQRQRIAIASALISEPELIILDEPVSALDVSIRSQIMNLFKDIQKNHGITYFLVAHDLGTTRYMADEMIVMYLGRIMEKTETEELFNNKMHPYTKVLFESALPGDPAIKKEKVVLRGEVPSPLDPPKGCPFHTRCPVKIGSRCETEIPKLNEINGSGISHMVACHLI